MAVSSWRPSLIRFRVHECTAEHQYGMSDARIPPDIATLSFEDALAQLEAIVRELEAGQSKLDAAIQAYERGALLKAHCEAKLREAQMTVERIARTAEGGITVEAAGIEQGS